jgi:hypothetical protein
MYHIWHQRHLVLLYIKGSDFTMNVILKFVIWINRSLKKKNFIKFIVSDRASQQDCLTGTPAAPTTTTTTQTTTTPQVIFDLAARPQNTSIICRGSEVTIQVPKNFTLFPIDLYYGVTKNGSCSSYRYILNLIINLIIIICFYQVHKIVNQLLQYHVHSMKTVKFHCIMISFLMIVLISSPIILLLNTGNSIYD